MISDYATIDARHLEFNTQGLQVQILGQFFHNGRAVYRARNLSTFRTGIIGLDSLLGGGYPRSRVILISGGPGSGKTLMSMQFLVDGVERFDEKGIFVSLEESKYHLTNEMANYGWDLAKYEKKNQIAIVDASPLRQAIKESHGEESAADDLSESEKEVHIMGPRFSIQALSTVVRTFARITHATRIAIDPITSLSLQFEETSQRRSAIIDLFDSLASLGTTSLVTSEIGTHFGYSLTQREIPPEEYSLSWSDSASQYTCSRQRNSLAT